MGKEIFLPSHCDRLTPKSRELLKSAISKVIEETRPHLVPYVSVLYPETNEIRFAYIDQKIQGILNYTSLELMESNIFPELIESVEAFDEEGNRVKVTKMSVSQLKAQRLHPEAARPQHFYSMADESFKPQTVLDLPNSGGRLEEEVCYYTGDLLSLTKPLGYVSEIFIRKEDQLAALQEAHKALAEAYRKKEKDGLTGVYTNDSFMDEFGQRVKEINNARPEKDRKLGLIFCDLDGFKPINDTYGHAAGDFILEEVGEILNSEVREYDMPGRKGGDEFFVQLPDADLEKTTEVAVRILNRFKKPFVWKNENGEEIEISVGITIGVGESSELEQLSAEAFLDLADKRIYIGKDAGKNVIVGNSGVVARI